MIENPLKEVNYLKEETAKNLPVEVSQRKVLILGDVAVQAMKKGKVKEANISSGFIICLKLLYSLPNIESF